MVSAGMRKNRHPCTTDAQELLPGKMLVHYILHCAPNESANRLF